MTVRAVHISVIKSDPLRFEFYCRRKIRLCRSVAMPTRCDFCALQCKNYIHILIYFNTLAISTYIAFACVSRQLILHLQVLHGGQLNLKSKSCWLDQLRIVNSSFNTIIELLFYINKHSIKLLSNLLS